MTYANMFLLVMGAEYLVGSALYCVQRDYGMAGVLLYYGMANFFLVWR